MKNTENENFPVSNENREIEAITQRLKIAVENADGNKAVSQRSGVPLSTLNGYLAGRDMKASAAARLAVACGVDVSWLLAGSSPKSRASVPAESANGNLFDIPVYDIELSAGCGALPNELERVAFKLDGNLIPPELHHRKKNLVALTARGDSMEPFIMNGDVLIIDTEDRQISTGCVYGLRIGDQLLVKRLSVKIDGSIEVLSDNPRYGMEIIDASRALTLINDGGNPASIIGRVVWRAGVIFG